MVGTAELEGYWPLDSGSGLDLSGKGRDLTNLVNTGWAAGASGLALSLADRAVIRAAYGAAINAGAWSAFSVSLWCNKTAAAIAYERLLDFGVANVSGIVIACPTATDNAQFIFYRAGFQEVAPASNVFDATLRHYVLTFNLATKAWILYRSGVWFAGGTLTNTPVMPNTALTIGNSGSPLAANTWVGLIDEVRLYSRVLTPAEALDLYQNPGQTQPAGTPASYLSQGSLSNPARARMKMRVTLERNYSVQAAGATDVDGFGQKLEDWREVGTWPCWAWMGKPRTTLRDVGLVTVDAPGMIVPLNTDVVLGDRVKKITDRAGRQLFGAMGITGIAPRLTHLELQLESAA